MTDPRASAQARTRSGNFSTLIARLRAIDSSGHDPQVKQMINLSTLFRIFLQNRPLPGAV